MRAGLVGLSALGFAIGATDLEAQARASVVVATGPVITRVHVGLPLISYGRPRPMILVGRPGNRVILLERAVWHEAAWWKRHGYRPVRFWFDGHRFFERPVRAHGLREVILFERGGRFYLVDDRLMGPRGSNASGLSGGGAYYGGGHNDGYRDREWGN